MRGPGPAWRTQRAVCCSRSPSGQPAKHPQKCDELSCAACAFHKALPSCLCTAACGHRVLFAVCCSPPQSCKRRQGPKPVFLHLQTHKTRQTAAAMLHVTAAGCGYCTPRCPPSLTCETRLPTAESSSVPCRSRLPPRYGAPSRLANL